MRLLHRQVENPMPRGVELKRRGSSRIAASTTAIGDERRRWRIGRGMRRDRIKLIRSWMMKVWMNLGSLTMKVIHDAERVGPPSGSFCSVSKLN